MLVALDTNVLIYMFEQNPEFLPKVYPIFQAIEEGRISGIISVLVVTETLTYPIKMGDEGLRQRYSMVFSTFPNLMVVDVDQKTAVIAAKIRATYDLRPVDAIMVATAICNNCDVFITNDSEVAKITEIRVLNLQADNINDIIIK